MGRAGPRHLVIDARTVRPGATGVGHCVAGWLRGVNAVLPKTPEWRVSAWRLVKGTEGGDGVWCELENIDIVETGVDYEQHPQGDWWLQRHSNDWMRRLSGDVLLSPAFIGPWRRRSFKRLLVVPDAIAWQNPENYPKAFGAYLRKATAWSARQADRLLTLSPASAAQIRNTEFGRKLRPRLLPCGYDPGVFHPAESRPENSRPVIIYTASFEPRKNHDVLFEALRHEQVALLKPKLVLLHRATESEIADVKRRAGRIDVEVVTPKSSQDIADWTRRANLAVFPSRNEGFGIPALEAMASGIPLVASRIGAMEWLTEDGECAALVDPDDVARWARAIRRVLDGSGDVEHRRRLALGRARQFTWSHAAEQLLAHAAEVV